MIRHIIAVISAFLIWLMFYIFNKDIAIGASGSIVGFIIVELYFFMRKNDLDLTFLGLKRLLYVFKKRKIIKKSITSDSLADYTFWLKEEFVFPLSSFHKEIDKTVIQKLSSFEAAIFILLINDNHNCIDCSYLTSEDFKELFTKALKESFYKRLILKESLSQIIKPADLEKLLIKFEEQLIVDCDLSNENTGNDLFTNKVRELCVVGGEIKISIFSTTSQLSHDILKDLKAYQTSTTKVDIDFYICSPNVKADSAILELTKEYEVPAGALPDQFVKASNKKAHVEMDIIRRVFRVLRSFKDIKDNQESYCKTSVYLYKKSYPGCKIRLIENKFVELQPGPLKFANNLYRFRIASTDSEVINTLSDAVKNFKDGNEVQCIELLNQPIEQAEKQALLELAEWLISRGIKTDDLSKYATDIHAFSGDQETRARLKFLQNRIGTAYKAITNLSNFTNEELCAEENFKQSTGSGIREVEINNNIKHITVAAIFTNDNKILLIEKAKEFYEGKYSLVAGHVEYQDNTLADAVEREVNEEIGLNINSLTYICHIDDLTDKCGHGGEIHDWHVFNSYEIIDENSLKLGAEVKSIKWVSLNELQTMKEELTDGACKIFNAMGWLK
ncbi:NUDIX hydrolase [Pseudoalteromonas sp. SR43-3]|uniref:NUDIX hydrolase n=1 Tax=Pseudoalteromonas sp. SR43-3 TaxID=2760943 RepID=UPI0016033C67|nr:NUDIX hydrolase [Pseudoalteromonas sp. SR43-3]MBB1275828.1 NUDIX hydrolase [Pseudoalteromonas sp. SR43-3]